MSKKLEVFEVFLSAKMPGVVREHPDLSHDDRVTEVAQMWQALSDQAKSHWRTYTDYCNFAADSKAAKLR